MRLRLQTLSCGTLLLVFFILLYQKLCCERVTSFTAALIPLLCIHVVGMLFMCAQCVHGEKVAPCGPEGPFCVGFGSVSGVIFIVLLGLWLDGRLIVSLGVVCIPLFANAVRLLACGGISMSLIKSSKSRKAKRTKTVSGEDSGKLQDEKANAYRAGVSLAQLANGLLHLVHGAHSVLVAALILMLLRFDWPWAVVFIPTYAVLLLLMVAGVVLTAAYSSFAVRCAGRVGRVHVCLTARMVLSLLMVLGPVAAMLAVLVYALHSGSERARDVFFALSIAVTGMWCVVITASIVRSLCARRTPRSVAPYEPSKQPADVGVQLGEDSSQSLPRTVVVRSYHGAWILDGFYDVVWDSFFRDAVPAARKALPLDALKAPERSEAALVFVIAALAVLRIAIRSAAAARDIVILDSGRCITSRSRPFFGPGTAQWASVLHLIEDIRVVKLSKDEEQTLRQLVIVSGKWDFIEMSDPVRRRILERLHAQTRSIATALARCPRFGYQGHRHLSAAVFDA